MKAYRDPTSHVAVGNVDKEMKRMAKLAVRLREGRRNPSWVQEMEKEFTGIYSSLLTDPIEYVKKKAR